MNTTEGQEIRSYPERLGTAIGYSRDINYRALHMANSFIPQYLNDANVSGAEKALLQYLKDEFAAIAEAAQEIQELTHG
jgi:hypothetical protein